MIPKGRLVEENEHTFAGISELLVFSCWSLSRKHLAFSWRLVGQGDVWGQAILALKEGTLVRIVANSEV